jgi:endonuclease III related protein
VSVRAEPVEPRLSANVVAQGDVLRQALDRLLEHYDVERWHWSAATPVFDICIGAILVQHTAWANVEKALSNLTAAEVDSAQALEAVQESQLAALVRPAGTPVVKARRLKAFAKVVLAHGGFEGLLANPIAGLRSLLLSTDGIGPETADVILLYAARQPVMVHDAYTARLCRRLGVGPERDTYDAWRTWLDEILPPDVRYRQRAHAAIVVHCKETCRVKPRCSECPIVNVCKFASALNESSVASLE